MEDAAAGLLPSHRTARTACAIDGEDTGWATALLAGGLLRSGYAENRLELLCAARRREEHAVRFAAGTKATTDGGLQSRAGSCMET